MFNEGFPSVYTRNKATSNECSFFTIPFVDGYVWSAPGKIAGLRFKAIANGATTELQGGDPVVSRSNKGKLHIAWPLTTFKGTLVMDIDEQRIGISIPGAAAGSWFLDLSAAGNASLPFKTISAGAVRGQFENWDYSVTAAKGRFSKPNDSIALRITPENNAVILNLSPSQVH